jgi:hypothetical protein
VLAEEDSASVKSSEATVTHPMLEDTSDKGGALLLVKVLGILKFGSLLMQSGPGEQIKLKLGSLSMRMKQTSHIGSQKQ